jgi:LysM repeat protein
MSWKCTRKAFLIVLISVAIFLSGCEPATNSLQPFSTYDPFIPIDQATQKATTIPTASATTSPTPTRKPTPTRVPLTVSPPAGLLPGATGQTPTPDAAHILPTPRQDTIQYIVQPGDSLGSIALQFDLSVKILMESNQIKDPNLLEAGTILTIPAPNPTGSGPSFKVLPDSELVYGPSSTYFDLESFIDSQNGYLETYTEDLKGTLLTSSEIVRIVSQNYSINPRLLLALLEYQSGWVTNPEPFNTDYPMGMLDDFHQGLYRQLTWAADTLNRGYYLWRANAISTVALNDGSIAPLDTSINAGTAAIQYFFAKMDDRATWEKDAGPTGLLLTYFVFFGNPFDYAIEPLLPSSLEQPELKFPFSEADTWYFTGGPHGAWDSGTAWAALDFAPPGDNGTCMPNPLWVTALADGLIVRASNGAVIQDLDNDGYEQTGWVIFYMHVANEGRVSPGEYLYAGERIGHPSCEGGISNASHVHIARKFNGEWIAADGSLPFNLEGWISSGNGVEYDGFLTNGVQILEAYDGAHEGNAITR